MTKARKISSMAKVEQEFTAATGISPPQVFQTENDTRRSGIVASIRAALEDADSKYFVAGDGINDLLTLDPERSLRRLAQELGRWSASFLSKLSTVARAFGADERKLAADLGGTWNDCYYICLYIRKSPRVTETLTATIRRYIDTRNAVSKSELHGDHWHHSEQTYRAMMRPDEERVHKDKAKRERELADKNKAYVERLEAEGFKPRHEILNANDKGDDDQTGTLENRIDLVSEDFADTLIIAVGVGRQPVSTLNSIPHKRELFKEVLRQIRSTYSPGEIAAMLAEIDADRAAEARTPNLIEETTGDILSAKADEVVQAMT